MRYRVIGAALLMCLTISSAEASDGRLLATGGVTTIEGSAGGGIVPWAVLGSYAEEGQWGATTALSQASVDDFDLNVISASFNYQNRLELSVSRQDFSLNTIGGELNQNILGAKYRLTGDLIYGSLPQLSVGVQYKRNTRFELPENVGAQRNADWDAYLAVSRAWLAGPFDRTWLANATVRATRANQIGLLGFGGDASDNHELVVELAGAVFLHRSLAIGVEYRQKPNNLNFADESDWMSAFIAWFPSKSVSLTGAFLDLGDIAGLQSQQGYYLSIQAAF